jgi:uncharacterized RDD family membrane protein YckC
MPFSMTLDFQNQGSHLGAKIMKCSKCGYNNLPEGTRDSRCDECGYLLFAEGSNFNTEISNSVTSASTGKRAVNLIGDLIIFRFVITAADLIFSSAGGVSASVTEPGANWLFGILLIFLYYFLFETGFQRTPAKFITRTKVVMQDGSKPSNRSIALRTLVRLVPFLVFSMSSDGTWWHDRWTDTRVVDSER